MVQGHIVSFIFITWRRLEKHTNHIVFMFHQLSFMLVIQLSYSDSRMPVKSSLSSIRFGVSLWDTPLLRIPRSPITLRQPQLAGRRDVVSGSGVPTLSIKGATQRHYDIQKPLLASHQKPLTNSSTNNWPPRRFSPDSFNFAFQPIERIVRYYDSCRNAVCTG